MGFYKSPKKAILTQYLLPHHVTPRVVSLWGAVPLLCVPLILLSIPFDDNKRIMYYFNTLNTYTLY